MTKLEKLDVSGCGKLQSFRKLAGCSVLTQLDVELRAHDARPHGLQRAENRRMLV